MKLKLYNTLLLLVFLLTNLCYAETDKYRLIVNDDPTTTVTIGFNALDGIGHKVFFGTTDQGTNTAAYTNVENVYKSFDNFRGMNTKFVKLTNLTPKTTYYFVVSDDNSVSRRFYFKTASDDPNDPISLIMGGDSRNNRDVRQNANRLVSKIKPDVVTFAGDMTDRATTEQWKDWLDDWQETIGSDGRMTPIIVAQGNHENNVFSTISYIERLFDAPILGYYAVEYNTLLKIFTLNTETSISGNQTTWLASELSTSWNFTWKIAQYHQAMRPHYSSKADGTLQYTNWADLFFNYQVRLVQESDVHLCKTTWPVRPTPSGSEPNEDQGFVKDDFGTVYTGAGCWGAPLREPDDIKLWTRDAGSINHFQWVIISQDKIDVRTVLTDNADEVCPRSDSSPVDEIPINLNIWNPDNGELIRIPNESVIDCSSNFIASSLEGNAPLIVNFNANNSFCYNSGSTPTYSWNFGDGNTAINTSVTSNTFIVPGKYNVTLQMERNGIKYYKNTEIIVNNPVCFPDPIVINEIQFSPDPLADTGDYIELYNPNAFGVDLSCFSITTTQHSYILDNVFIPANSYYIIVENPDLFNTINPSLVNISDYSGINLSELGDEITLVDEAGCVIDYVKYDITSPWPTSASPYILMLNDPTLDNSLAASWSTSLNGTVGITNFPINSTKLYLKVFLEGPYDPTSNQMLTALQSNNLLPNAQPYNNTNHNYAGLETAVHTNPYVTDWVYIELRDPINPANIIDSRAAFLRNDGTLLDIDNQEGVTFHNAPSGAYKVAVYHKAHLGIISNSVILLPNTSITPLDITNNIGDAMGIQQLKQLSNGTCVLYCGDFDGNGLINNIDYNYWGSSNAVINQYVNWDSDLNALVNNLDYNNWDNNKSKVGILEIQK